MAYILDEYDDLLERILKKGKLRKNRTGVDSLAIFGTQIRINISECFPLPTRRKIAYKSSFAELLWMLSGSTNVNDLKELGSGIWNAWEDKDFEQKHGYISGSLGKTYGFQMRYFGGEFGNGSSPFLRPPQGSYFAPPYYADYGAKGKDQVQYVVDLLKNDPTSRRIIINLWNAKDLDCMKLPPCLYSYQFNVDEDKLSCMITMRSCDFMAGGIFNIVFSSALTYMLCQQTGSVPNELIHTIADAHIYVDQIPMVEEYLSRPKPDSPKLKLNKAKDIFSYQVSDFEIVDYNPLPSIKIPVAV